MNFAQSQQMWPDQSRKSTPEESPLTSLFEHTSSGFSQDLACEPVLAVMGARNSN
jgi:hypothetical protein